MNVATEADYFTDEDVDADLANQLARTARSSARASILLELGDHEMRRARLHTAVFGPDPHDDGVDASVWLADSARLLWIVAEAEYERAQRSTAPLQWSEYAARHDSRTIELQRHVDHLLDCWTTRRLRLRRIGMLASMTHRWLEVTGGQAVESVWCCAARMPRWAR